MPPELSPEVLVRAASGGLLLLLGVLVGLLRPRTGASASFAWFSSSFGLQFVFANAGVALGEGDPARGPLLWAASAAFFVATLSLGVFAASFPLRARRAGLHRWFWAATIGGVHAAGGLFAFFGVFGEVAPWSAGIAEEVGEFPNRVFLLVFQMLLGALFSSLVFLAMRYRRSARDKPEHARSVLLVSAALLLYPAYNAGASLLDGIALARGGGPAEGAAVFLLQGWLGVASCMVLALIWLTNIGASPNPRSCRNLAWLALAVPLGAFLLERWDSVGGVGAGVARILSVVVLAYAVVRRQLFDLDLKVKWTLRNSTVAAIFVAAFFIVSELAAALLTPRLGTVLGIVAAGALLFVMAPLQRLGERVSEQAMPGVADTREYRLVRKRAVYLAAVESAAFDGEITDKERHVLVALADQLGLTAADARRIERRFLAAGGRAA